MGSSWIIAKREFKSYFSTPVGYVVLGAFALISGLGFAYSFIVYGFMTETPANYELAAIPDFEETFLSEYMVYCGLMMMFIGPLISMKLLAEEHNLGTIEMLYTLPLRDRDIIFGKYFAAIAMLGLMILTTGVHLVIVYFYVDVEIEVLLFGLLAFFLMGAAFLSMGLFVSSLCKTQITAATVTFAVYFVLFMIGTLSDKIPDAITVPETWPESVRSVVTVVHGGIQSIALELPIDAHARQMAQGIFQPADVAYYFLFIGFFLFLTFRSLETRKWRS
ncbi:MAG: ABC transporter permease [Candidatus Hydrogenedentota bacterium]